MLFGRLYRLYYISNIELLPILFDHTDERRLIRRKNQIHVLL